MPFIRFSDLVHTGDRTVRRACAMVVAVALAACAGSTRESRRCEWPTETYRLLDLTRSPDRAHLRIDAESAETIAIHYADVSPARQKGREEYAEARDVCMASLFGAVARTHAVDIALVRAYTTVRNRRFDALVLISFAVIYALVAYLLAGRVVQLTGTEDGSLIVVAVIALALGAALIGLMVFDIWAGTAESLRLHSWHLSYRTDRLPWRHHGVLLFSGGVGLFWLVSLLRYRRAI